MGKGGKPAAAGRIVRALRWARNLYESSLMGCASGSASRAVPRSKSRGFPVRSVGGGGADEDIADLIRAASIRASRLSNMAGTVVPRSQSVAAGMTNIGRIDEEEETCTFPAAAVAVPRSRTVGGGAPHRRAIKGGGPMNLSADT